MKFNIPKVLKPIFMREYAPEYGDGPGSVVWAWVNPPRAKLEELDTLLAETATVTRLAMAKGPKTDLSDKDALAARLIELSQQVKAWYAENWSQGEPETHWTAEEIQAIAELDSDPALWPWLSAMTRTLIGEHRDRKKKVLAARSSR